MKKAESEWSIDSGDCLIPCPSAPVELSRSTLPNGLDTFTFGCFRFNFTAQEDLTLPKYKGSLFRSGFGSALKQISCSQNRAGNCRDCILTNECAYAYLFETPVLPHDTGLIEGMSDAPHPMILRPPICTKREYKTGDQFEAEIILIGRALRFLPHVIYACQDFGSQGFCEKKGLFKMHKVSSLAGGNWQEIYRCEEGKLHQAQWISTLPELAYDQLHRSTNYINLNFITPLRIKSAGSITDSLNFHILIKNVLRRISILDSLHCSGEITFDLEKLLALSVHVETSLENLWWTDWSRYSKRQNREVVMGGVIGEICFSGDLTEFLPYLLLGEIVHVGKGTAFGLGRISVKISDGKS